MRYGALLRVSKNASMVLLGTVIRMALAFAFVVFAARQFGVEGYGKFALGLSLFETFLSLSVTGLCILVTRETAKEREWLAQNMRAVLPITLALGIGAAVMLLIVSQVADYAPDTKLALLFAAIAIVPASVSLLAEAIFVSWEKAEFVAMGTASESLLRTGLSFIAVWSGLGVASLFVVLLLTRTAQLGLYSTIVLRKTPISHWQSRPGATLAVLRQWKVFAAENWLSMIASGLDVFLLSLFHGEAAVGVYDAAWKLIRLSAVVAHSFTTAVFPFISRLYIRAEEAFHRVSLQSVKYMLAVLLPVAVTFSALADQIVLWLYGNAFAESVPVLKVLAWLMIPQFVNPFLSHTLFARHEQRRSLIVAAVNLIVFLGGALLLIPTGGAVGAAMAILISSSTACVCYLACCVWGHDSLGLLKILARQTVAAGSMCALLFFMPGSSVWEAILVGLALYMILLFALRIVTWNDVKLLQELH